MHNLRKLLTVTDFRDTYTEAIIEHYCVIGDNIHIALGVILSDSMKGGERTRIRTGSSVMRGIEIRNDVITGTGNIATNNVKNNKKVLGIPAKEEF